MKKETNTQRRGEPDYLTTLRGMCSSAVLSVTREEDVSFDWDGDGPDPKRRGYLPYDVDVTVTTIAEGKFISGTSSLGGSYYKCGEPLGDVHGYLPQMLEEAMNEVLDDPSVAMLTRDALQSGVTFIKEQMRQQYLLQQSKRINQKQSP